MKTAREQKKANIAAYIEDSKRNKVLFVIETAISTWATITFIFAIIVQLIYGFYVPATILATLAAFLTISTFIGARENYRDWKEAEEAIDDEFALVIECKEICDETIEEVEKALETQDDYKIDKPCDLIIEFIRSNLDDSKYDFVETDDKLIFFELLVF